MIITDLKKHFKQKLKGVIHIGAHHGQEKKWYKENNISPILWIDANPEYLEILEKVLEGEDKVIISGIGNSDEKKMFNISNNGQSSSFLNLGTHKVQHPEVHYQNQIEIQIKKMSDLIVENEINIEKYNFINLDVQGFELEVLKGFGDLLKNFDYIYSEVNLSYLYEGCALISEIDNFLSNFNFERVETSITVHNWGDAFYVKKK